MSLTNNIAKNTAIQVAGKIAGTVLALITAGVIFRYLGDTGVGQYTKVLAFLQLFAIMMDFGFYIILIKKLAHLDLDKLDDPIVHNIFTLRIVSGVIFLSLAPLSAWIISLYNNAYDLTIVAGIAIATLFYFCISLNQLLSAIFQRAMKTSWIALGEFIGKIALLVFVILFVYFDFGLWWVLFAHVISSVTNFLIQFLATRSYVKLKLVFNWPLWKQILKEAWPIAVSIGFALIYFKGDTIILSFYEPNNVVGWYGAPYKILEVLVTFPAMFVGLVLPLLNAAWQKKDLEKFKNVLQKALDALTVVAMPLVGGTLALAPMIIRILAGSEFQNSNNVLRILIIAVGAIYLGTLLSYVVVSLNKQKSMMWGYAFVAISSLLGYFIFIPSYSIFGAAWVTVYSEIAVAIIALVIILRTTKIHLSGKVFIKSITASAVMFFFLMIGVALLQDIYPATHLLEQVDTASTRLDFSLLSLVVFVPFGAVVYFFILWILQGINQEDLRQMFKLKK